MQSPWQSSTLVLEVHGTKTLSKFQNYAEEPLSDCNTYINRYSEFLLNFKTGKHGPKSLFIWLGPTGRCWDGDVATVVSIPMSV